MIYELFSDYVSYSARGSEYEFEKSHWIITDVRFPNNEGKAVTDRGGLLIGVKRLFKLRFPEYENITDLNDSDDGYEIPSNLELVDPVGERAGVLISRDGYHGLPLILGVGAQDHAEEALEILAAAMPIADRIRGLRRMGERRWDVMLDRKQIIQLPVEDPVPALERVIALHSARDVLGRDVTVVDM